MSAVTPRLGFCQRCGDPISGKLRCSRCGGTSKEPRVLPTALPAARKLDPWANRYVHTSSVSSVDEEYTHDRRPPLSPKRSTYDPQLGFGMPSRISRDLRSSAMVQSDSTPSDLRAPPAEMQRRPSQDYTAPVVKGSDGVLSKVCGSLVEPDASRNRWSCTGCSTVFARDSTLYAAPSSSLSGSEGYFCRECYAEKYSLGDCKACKKAVLGSTKEDGKFVRATAGIWHGRCWKCSVCSKGGREGVDVLVGMDGEPTCEGCFDRPRRRVGEPERKDEVGVPDVRRITRTRANGPMGATIAELTKKLGQQTVASPRIPFSTRSGSNASNITASSSNSSNDTPRSPSKYAFPNHVPTSPGKSGMTRSGSITGSPPKPRPLTAQFRDGLNLAAFKSTFGADDEGSGVERRDSRSRSVSPVKRLPSAEKATSSDKLAEKVPGSPSTTPSSSTRLQVVTDPTRRRTSSGFPRPLNFAAAEAGDPVQGEKSSSLEPASGSVRCASCHLLPFDRTTSAQEVAMVTLADDVHMHAECFTCSPCGGVIDGEKTFVRLDEGYAHPQCAPRVTLQVVSVKAGEEAGERSFRSSVGEGGHATHQRELKPSPVPSPAASIGRRSAVPAASSAATASSTASVAFRRFQPAQASTTPTPNPAAGFFTTHHPSAASTSRYGGMHNCAYCGEKLSHLESTLGPRSTQWHKKCLVCRGVLPQPNDVWRRKGQDVLCGKRLDSGAKVNADGEVRCRDCFGRECARF